VLSGFVLWLIIPRGVGNLVPTKNGFGRTFWGMQRNEWVDWHAWLAVFIIAIIVIHIVIHWRWIVHMTLGKMKVMKNRAAARQSRTGSLEKPKAEESAKSYYLSRIGVYIGLIGAIGFLVAMLTFQLDWANKYNFMLYFIPIPFILLILARRYPLIGGITLIILGMETIMLYLIFPIGIRWNLIGVWNKLGAETIYTIVFVTLPLIASGILYLVSWIKNKRKII
jgi:hypothetical protein